MTSAPPGEIISPPSKFLAILKPMEAKSVEQDFPAAEGAPHQGQMPPNLSAYGPLSKWDLTWKKNYFAATQNIYEPRGDKYVCKECGALFPSRLSILTHSKIHLKPFCVVCREYTDTKSAMEFHMRHDHQGYTYYKNILSSDGGAEDASNTITASELYVRNKLRKVYFANKNRLKKASTAPPLKQPPEHFTKVVTSRFGRCITVKLPDF